MYKKDFFFGAVVVAAGQVYLCFCFLSFQTRDALDSDFGHEGGTAPS